MENKQLLAEKKFLLNCGYTMDEVKALTEGFGVTDALPPGPETHPSVLNSNEGSSIEAKAAAAVKYNQLLSILTNIWRGKIPPQIKDLSSDIARYFNS